MGGAIDVVADRFAVIDLDPEEEGVTRIADSFAVLGDADVAAHVRGMVVAR